MKIHKLSEQAQIEWLADIQATKAPVETPKKVANTEQVTRILSKQSMDEDDLVVERDEIEKCAASKTPYVCNEKWGSDVIDHLKEYGSTCGLQDFEVVNPENVEVPKVAESNQKIVTASIETKSDPKVINLGDPFHLDTKGDTSNLFQGHWEEVKKAQKLPDCPSMVGNVIPIRGSESYFSHSVPPLANGQNSIANPDAIEKFIAEGSDSGAKIKAAIKDKEDRKLQEKKDWQTKNIEEISKADLLPRASSVFLTETLHAQSGVNQQPSLGGAYSKFNKDDIPEKTEGEKLKGINAEVKSKIQRPVEKDRTWEKSEKSSGYSISDEFFKTLKEKMGQKS